MKCGWLLVKKSNKALSKWHYNVQFQSGFESAWSATEITNKIEQCSNSKYLNLNRERCNIDDITVSIIIKRKTIQIVCQWMNATINQWLNKFSMYISTRTKERETIEWFLKSSNVFLRSFSSKKIVSRWFCIVSAIQLQYDWLYITNRIE